MWQTDERVLEEVWNLLAIKTLDFDLGNVPEEHRVHPLSLALFVRLSLHIYLKLATQNDDYPVESTL